MAEGANGTKTGQQLAVNRRRLKRWTVFAITVAFLFAAGIPAIAPTLNVVRIAGFPLGYYLAAQGVPLFLAILLFVHARRANRWERADGSEAGGQL